MSAVFIVLCVASLPHLSCISLLCWSAGQSLIGMSEQEYPVNTSSTISTGINGTLPSPRKFFFTKEFQLLMLQAVRQHDAHKAIHGKKDEAFGDVVRTFVDSVPATTWRTMKKPTIKTLRDKFRALLADRKIRVERNHASAGIAEEVGPMDQLLDDFKLEMDNLEEQRRTDRIAQYTSDQALQHESDVIQRYAGTSRQTVGDSGAVSSRITPSKRRSVDHDETWLEMMKEDLRSKRAARERELCIQERQLELREKEFEEKKKDREVQREQIRTTLRLLSALSEKLN